MSRPKFDRPGVPRLDGQLNLRIGRGGWLVPRSGTAKGDLAEFAEAWDVDESTVLDWANGREEPPDELIDYLVRQRFCHSVGHYMRWDDAPRSVIPSAGGASWPRK